MSRDQAHGDEAELRYESLFSDPVAGAVNAVDTAPVDGWLSAYMYNDADQASTLSVLTGPDIQPSTLVAAATGLNWSSIYRLSAQPCATPLAANSNYLARLDTSVVPANAAGVRRFDTAPGLKVFGAPKPLQAPAPGAPLSFKAETDGVLSVMFTTCSDSGASSTVWTAAISIGSNTLAACSASWGSTSCVAPIPAGSTCTVAIGVPQGDATWGVQAVWTPIVGAKLDAPQYNLQAGVDYPAKTDGFLLVALTAADWTYTQADCVVTDPAKGQAIFALSTSAAGFREVFGILEKFSPVSTMILPVSRGRHFSITRDLYNPAAALGVTWVPIRR